jgi:ketosteroid isomerase-like protein
MRRAISRSVLTFALIIGIATASSTTHAGSETDAVRSANEAFEAALSARDIHAMEQAWSHGPEAMAIHPNAKSVVVGWDAVKASWEAVFGRFLELSASMRDPQIRAVGNFAWVVGVEEVKGRRPSGESVGYGALATNIFEKREGRWLIVLHQVSRVPE